MRFAATACLFFGLVIFSGSCGEADRCLLIPTNHDPVMLAQWDTAVALGDTLILRAVAHDEDGDTLTYAWAVNKTYYEMRDGYRLDVDFDSTTGYFEFRPRYQDRPYRAFAFSVDDGRGGNDFTKFVVWVN